MQISDVCRVFPMTQPPLTLLRPDSPPHFPPPEQALRQPNGLLALGGELSRQRLLSAYRQGIFPWSGDNEPLLWWSPDPRCVFHTAELEPGRTLRKHWRRSGWTITFNRAFEAVMRGCAAPRGDGEGGTWITPAMIAAYSELHAAGDAHSIEVWDGAQLVGGLYGVAIGSLFCGESMFSAQSGGSKTALVCLGYLLEFWGMPLLDAQVANPHLYRMGAVDMPRTDYLARVHRLTMTAVPDTALRVSAPIPVADFLHPETLPHLLS